MKQNTSSWTNRRRMALAGVISLVLGSTPAPATERRFTYSYEPETLPKGVTEFEQHLTLGTQRTKGGSVQQENFNQWGFREELEYGVTDKYTLGFYLNAEAESFRDVSASPVTDHSEFKFEGISLENRYQWLNPAEHAVGVTFYLEPSFSGSEAELEEKIIIGQRHGDWKWALNLTHATEGKDNFHATEGEVEITAGLARDLNTHWSLGLEFRNHNEIEEYQEWKHSAFFLGPVVSYRTESWWATLTVLPQVFGKNYDADPDGNSSLVLDEHERVNVRLLIGFGF